MARPELLNESEVQRRLAELPGWSGDSQRIAWQPMASDSFTKSGTRVPALGPLGSAPGPECSTVLEDRWL